MYQPYHEQEWQQVIVRKRRPFVPTENQRKHAACATAAVSSVTGSVAYKIEQAADGEGKKLPLVSAVDSKAIINARLAKKWSREDLARHCNLDVKIVADIETGKAFENKAQLAKIKRILQ